MVKQGGPAVSPYSTGSRASSIRRKPSSGASETSPQGNGMLHARKIKKVSRACDHCKAKKLRCTGTLPCAGCTKRRLSCVYDAEYRRGRPPTPPGVDETTPRADQQPGAIPEVDSRDSSAALDGQPGTSRGTPELESETAGLQGQYSDQTSGLTFLHRAWKRLSLQRGSNDATTSHVALTAGQDNSQHQPLFSAGDEPYPAFDPSQVRIPDHDTAMGMLGFYFDTCVITYRFLHHATVASWLAVVVANHGSGLPLFHHVGHAKASIILTVLAIVTLRQCKFQAAAVPPATSVPSDAFFLMSTGLTNAEVGYPTLESAQARLLQTLYLLQSTRMNQAWFIFGSTLPIVSALGLHRAKRAAPSGLGNDTSSYISVQIQRRTFWVFFTIDKYLAVVFGRPPHYHPDDTDQEFPDRVNDEDMTPGGRASHEPVMECHVDSLIFHAKLAQLIDATSRQVYSLKRVPQRKRLTTALEFGRALHEWRQELPYHLGSMRPLSLIPPFRRQANALRLAYCHALMHANRPFLLAKNTSNPAALRDSVEDCIAAARTALETVDQMSTDKSFFYSLWWMPYVTFCALAVVYVWDIQQQRSGGVDNTTAQLRPELSRLAERCRSHLATAGAPNSPSTRYNIILEELYQESTRRNHSSATSEANSLASAGGAEGPQDMTHLQNMNYAQSAQFPGQTAAGGSSFQDFSLLDDWQMSDWLDLDSSGSGCLYQSLPLASYALTVVCVGVSVQLQPRSGNNPDSNPDSNPGRYAELNPSHNPAYRSGAIYGITPRSALRRDHLSTFTPRLRPKSRLNGESVAARPGALKLTVYNGISRIRQSASQCEHAQSNPPEPMPSPLRITNGSRRARPCDACRRRKRRCVVEDGSHNCQLCLSAGAQCSFESPAAERGSLKRRASEHDGGRTPSKRVSQYAWPDSIPAVLEIHNNEIFSVASPSTVTETHSFGDPAGVIEDYDALPTASLLKRNLGLQQHQYIRYVGSTDELDPSLLALRPVDEKKETRFPNGTSCRRVSRDTHFALIPYSRTEIRAQELQDLDRIENLVRPYGKSLVELYFKIIHPSFPILDKKTFMEKYARTHREFAPPCLAGVYMLASKWWHYDRELTSHKKPDIGALERIARSSLQGVTNRPKLSTLQGGLLLLQFHGSGDDGAWALSSQLVAVAQDLGIDSDCSGWTIPVWEKDLRTRLSWAIFMMDKWMALCRGRPSHIVDDDWTPAELTDDNLAISQDDGEKDDTTIECSTDTNAGGTAFKWMVSLTRIVSEILRKFYSRKALADTTSNIRTLLEQIKPVQVRLREWHRDLPSSLQLDAVADSQRLSSNSSLHLGYFASEIALHRVILTSLLRHSCDPFIVQICRDAARERVMSAVDLVTGLKPQDLQAFWYFPSGYCLVTIGTFTTLLFITSQSLTEAEFYRKTLDSYRWRLRVSSPAAEYMAFAMQKLDLSLSHIHELTSADIIGHSSRQTSELEQPQPVDLTPDTQSTQAPIRKRAPKRSHRRDSQGMAMRSQGRPENVAAASSPMPFYEDAILNAINDEPLLLDAAAQQHSFLMSLLPASPAFGGIETTPRTLEYDYQHSDPG